MQTGQPPQAVEYWKKQAESFDAIYSGEKSAFGRLLDKWLRKDIYDRFAWVMQQSGELAGKSVCDLGCGTGRYLVPFAQNGAQRVLGIDSAPAMIERAQKFIRDSNQGERCEARVGNILEVPTTELFHVTIAVGVFDYIADPVPFLARIKSITRGQHLSTWPVLWTWRMPIRKVRLGLLGCPVYFFTPQQVRACHAKAGFQVTRLERVGEIYCTAASPQH
jgi:2-polyprenyl-3-methyl-5-hydroxy-6-metoxy-1,4-benzoquinol methylase